VIQQADERQERLKKHKGMMIKLEKRYNRANIGYATGGYRETG